MVDSVMHFEVYCFDKIESNKCLVFIKVEKTGLLMLLTFGWDPEN